MTVEANPETVTPELAALLRRNRVNRVSIGAQSFNTRLLDVLDRVAAPDDVRRAVYVLRDAGFDNISLDLIYGIPGQSASDLERDLAEALALEPEHVSAYELEAKPGTRFTHAHGAELERQAESMESYFELVVETLTRRGLPLVRDRELLPSPTERAGTAATCGRVTTSATGSDGTTSASAWERSAQSRIGAGGTRPRCAATSRRSRRASLRLREYEELDARNAASGARHARAAPGRAASARGSRGPLDDEGLARLQRLGLAERRDGALALTERGRFLGDGVTARLLA